MSIILLKPILVEDGSDPKCVNDSEPYKNFTTPILSGMASTTPKIADTAGDPPFTGNNIFNVYQALGTTDASAPADEYRDDPAKTGSIKFGVTPCAEKIEIEVYGRADIYGAGFDTLTITIDGTQAAFFESTAEKPFYTRPASGADTTDETVTHTFAQPNPCGHIVEISGTSGTFANNNVGYDVKITVTLRTTPIT
jgi:hypothetical protein